MNLRIMITIECHICKKGFDVYPSRSQIKYCSTECRKVGWSRSAKANGSGGRQQRVSWTKKTCLHCENTFRVRSSLPKDKGKYCSNECRYAARVTITTTPCLNCGAPVSEPKSRREDGRGKYCSYKCRNKHLFVGKGHGRWKGGIKIDKSGYVLLWMPDHHEANSQGYVREHRYVMEQKIGRRLTRIEVVHHINHIKDDNRPENLMLFACSADHIKFHAREAA